VGYTWGRPIEKTGEFFQQTRKTTTGPGKDKETLKPKQFKRGGTETQHSKYRGATGTGVLKRNARTEEGTGKEGGN